MIGPVATMLLKTVPEEVRAAVAAVILVCSSTAMEHQKQFNDVVDETAGLFDDLNISIPMGVAVLLHMLDIAIWNAMEAVPSGQKALEEIDRLWRAAND
ncbi:MAG: hypothetical protein ACOX6M_13015 [Armatimonadota bacterium]|jgi:hypothetical protein